MPGTVLARDFTEIISALSIIKSKPFRCLNRITLSKLSDYADKT